MTRPARPALAFGVGAAVGTAGGLIGLGGAEFRLPALVGVLRFSARDAVAVNLVASLIVLAAAFPLRAASVPLAGSMAMLVGMPTIATGLGRHVASGSLLREAAVRRGTVLPLGLGPVLGAVMGALAPGLVPGQALKVGLGIILI